MSFPWYGVPLSAASLDAGTGALFDLDFRYADIDPDAGTLTTPSGHVGTWSRATTLASVADAAGGTYTALDGQMAWEQRTWDTSLDSFGLRMGSSDRIAFPSNMRAIAHAGLLEIIETGARTTSGATLFALRTDGATGAGLWLSASAGAYYEFSYSDGSTTRTATLSSGQPTSGQTVRFTWQLASDGALTFYQSINGAATTSASASALTLPSAWASSVSVRLNARGTSANPGQGWYRRLKLVAGTLDQTTIAERR